MCETDSAWIFYADEALSYALELVYLVEEQIYTEMVKDLRKIIMKNTLSLWFSFYIFIVLVVCNNIQLYLNNISMTDIDKWLEDSWNCKPITESSVRSLCNMVKNVLVD